MIYSVVRAARHFKYQKRWSKQLIKVPQDSAQKHVLFIPSAGGNTHSMKVSSVIAARFIKEGFKVSFLLCDSLFPACFISTIHFDRNTNKFAQHGNSALTCSSCFHAAAQSLNTLGIEYLKISDYIPRYLKEEILSLSLEIPLKSIDKYKVNNVNIGEHAYAGALRFFATGKPNDEHWKDNRSA